MARSIHGDRCSVIHFSPAALRAERPRMYSSACNFATATTTSSKQIGERACGDAHRHPPRCLAFGRALGEAACARQWKWWWRRAHAAHAHGHGISPARSRLKIADSSRCGCTPVASGGKVQACEREIPSVAILKSCTGSEYHSICDMCSRSSRSTCRVQGVSVYRHLCHCSLIVTAIAGDRTGISGMHAACRLP